MNEKGIEIDPKQVKRGFARWNKKRQKETVELDAIQVGRGRDRKYPRPGKGEHHTSGGPRDWR